VRAPHEHPADPALLGWIFAAAEAGCGAQVCSWCRQFFGLARELAEGQLTHGVCPACADKQKAEVIQ
jgi:hypothetical protein